MGITLRVFAVAQGDSCATAEKGQTNARPSP
jgi:hypothetical protein